MKKYGEIDLDETPILVLGCGHFFTAATLDGHMGMSDVYFQDGSGEFNGIRDISTALAQSVPRCPDCQCPVRQHCTKRFNRVINRAVNDEMSKHFLADGQLSLRFWELWVVDMELELTNSREDVIGVLGHAIAHRSGELDITEQLKGRYYKAQNLEKRIQKFLDLRIADLVPPVARDRRITLRVRAALLKVQSIILEDRIPMVEVVKLARANYPAPFPASALETQVKSFFKDSSAFIDDCDTERLPKYAVEVSLHYARTARAYQSYCRATSTDDHQFASQQVALAKGLLEKAKELCTLGFQTANALLQAVEGTLGLLSREWYEKVTVKEITATVEEITAIKKATVSGPFPRIVMYSGHWYNCANGHPFAIEECGMPMERARCPECGSPVGGEGHRAVEGVTRALDL
ncbi:MAG: hypothetical protein HETSPECPRED_009820 [Heterodermia speciosa]|uniref:RZ-type domain-containing protein n=1 Tax=Heterodermia speciosa TaxID=116794 RepID=A0A8H3IWH2_9LECA|nr:MAG: hypothetical protein HETSPECPRED_009820 [Heterodermia speciosa]